MTKFLTFVLAVLPTLACAAGIAFTPGSYEIPPDSIHTLDYIAAEITSALKENESADIIINGYTDDQGDLSANISLSLKRAEAVRDYLVENYGLKMYVFIVNGKGSASPIASNNTKAGRSENRRVEIILPKRKLVISSKKQEPTAWLKWFKNRVFVKPLQAEDWETPFLNKDLFRLDKVYNEKNSFSSVRFRNGGELDLSPRTIIIIYGDSSSSKKRIKENVFNIRLETGTLLNRLQKLKESEELKIETVAADITMKPGVSTLEVNAASSSLLSVFEGMVTVSAQGKKISVPAGSGNITEKGKAPGRVEKLPGIPAIIFPSGDPDLFPGDEIDFKWTAVQGADSYILSIAYLDPSNTVDEIQTGQT